MFYSFLFFLLLCRGVWPLSADFHRKAVSGQEEAVVLMREPSNTML